jgi:phenylacetic acid degradation operon negative regulatory protein
VTQTTGLFATGTGGGPAAEADIPTRTLVLGMAHRDGRIFAEEVYPVAEACGQSPDQVRSCLRRLVAEGLFERDGEGRSARFDPTPAGLDALGGSLDRIRAAYEQDAAGRGWDGHWHLVGFAVPEQRRAARDAFRDHLLARGGAAVQPGLYVSPTTWEDDVRTEAARLEVAEHVTTASTDQLDVGGERDPRAIALRLWPLEEVAERYRAFIAAYEGVPDQLDAMRRKRHRLADADYLPGALLIGTRFQECFALDPLLPPELLPRPWPGRAARELLARNRRLGVRLREEQGRPQLFEPFDELLGTLG